MSRSFRSAYTRQGWKLKEAYLAKKHTPDAMVDGMFMGAALLRSFVDEVVTLGGFPEMIHFLTTERGRETVKKLAQVVVESPWRIPRSLVEDLSFRRSSEEDGDDYPEYDRFHHWERVVRDFDLTSALLKFRGTVDSHAGCCDYDEVPLELLEQLVGTPLPRAPVVVSLDGDEYVLASLTIQGRRAQDSSSFGEPILEDGSELHHAILIPAKYFDMSR